EHCSAEYRRTCVATVFTLWFWRERSDHDAFGYAFFFEGCIKSGFHIRMAITEIPMGRKPLVIPFQRPIHADEGAPGVEVAGNRCIDLCRNDERGAENHRCDKKLEREPAGHYPSMNFRDSASNCSSEDRWILDSRTRTAGSGL